MVNMAYTGVKLLPQISVNLTRSPLICYQEYLWCLVHNNLNRKGVNVFHGQQAS